MEFGQALLGATSAYPMIFWIPLDKFGAGLFNKLGWTQQGKKSAYKRQVHSTSSGRVHRRMAFHRYLFKIIAPRVRK